MTATTGIGSFADVPLNGERSGEPATEAAVAEHVAAAAAAHGYTPDQLDWVTPEGIAVKPVYVGADRDAVVAAGYPLDSFPGEPPFIRGPYPTMYVNQPWTIRQSPVTSGWRVWPSIPSSTCASCSTASTCPP